MKILFICNQNENRSKTAEELFRSEYDTKSAGLYNKMPVNEVEVSWADVIVVMDDEQRSEIARRFPKQYMQKRILSLNISDIYSYDQSELKVILRDRMEDVMSIVATH